MASGPAKPAGMVESFNFAAASMSARKRLKDRFRNMAVDGTVRQDAASNTSSEIAHEIRRVRSRISKRVEVGATAAATVGLSVSGSITLLVPSLEA
jgi:hypothetical protein